MTDRVVLYARVSTEQQTGDHLVSIDQQLADMRALCERNKWLISAEFVDSENYPATQNPGKGKVVNPSGERADRPEFVKMLVLVQTGDVDALLCWRDDRLVRHPRVAVALEDTLDVGDTKRAGKGKIEVYDATGAQIDRFTLSIKATIWREENKRRGERTKMGKLGTLKEGRWPGEYRRYGYRATKVLGQRGRVIEEDPETAPVVRQVFQMYDSGMKLHEIRQFLVNSGVPQIYTTIQQHDWSLPLISRMLQSEVYYTAKAVWTFKDGTQVSVGVPRLIEPELWHRVQKRFGRNKTLSSRNARSVYLLQGLLYCADCDHPMSVTSFNGHRDQFRYRCHVAGQNPREGHPKPYSHSGAKLDSLVWRAIVDQGLRQPEVVQQQIATKVQELQREAGGVDSRIVRVQKHIENLIEERAFYQRQAARGKVTEMEFDRRMDETSTQLETRRSELADLKALRDDAGKVQDSLDYAKALFAKLRDNLGRLDCDGDTLLSLPEDERRNILMERKRIVQALVDKVTMGADRRIRIEGVLDGSEGVQFDLQYC